MRSDESAAEPQPEDLLIEARVRHSRFDFYIKVLDAFRQHELDYDQVTVRQMRSLRPLVGARWKEIASALAILRRARLV